jgi:hypothetical protein
MQVMSYEIVVEIDGVSSVIKLDDTYPSVNDWHSATEFAMRLAQHEHPHATQFEFVECAEYELEEYSKYDYIYEAPDTIQ